MQKHVEYSIIIAILCASFSYLQSQTGYSQSEQQNFTEPRFGITMEYPADWTFVPEEEAFSPGIYDYSVVVPPGSAFIGDFCPTVALNPNALDCGMYFKSGEPVYAPANLQVSVHKLEEGTTLKEFYDKEAMKLKESNAMVGRKNIETDKITVSGLPAIQRIDTIGGGSLDNIGQKSTTGKAIDVYLVNGDLGYRFFADTNDQDDFETYLPVFQKMIDSIQVQGAKDAPTNEQLNDTSTSKEKCETLNKIIEDIGEKGMKMECE